MMSFVNTESTLNIEKDTNNEEQEPVYTHQQLLSISGENLLSQIGLEVESFTQQVTMVNNAVSLNDVPQNESQQTAMLRQHYLTISAESFKTRIKEEIQGFTEHIASIGQEEATFNKRANLLLQCHTMSAYITNSLMEKLQKKKNPSK